MKKVNQKSFSQQRKLICQKTKQKRSVVTIVFQLLNYDFLNSYFNPIFAKTF